MRVQKKILIVRVKYVLTKLPRPLNWEILVFLIDGSGITVRPHDKHELRPIPHTIEKLVQSQLNT